MNCGFFLQLNIYSKTSRNRPTTGPILYGPFRKEVGLWSQDIVLGDSGTQIKRSILRSGRSGEWSVREVLLYTPTGIDK